MNKDGTTYLALVRFENGLERWELVHWGRPGGYSDPRGIPTWCSTAGFGLKIESFLVSYPLDDVLERVKTGPAGEAP